MLIPEQQRKVELVEQIIDYKSQQPEMAYIREALHVAGSGEYRMAGREVLEGNKRLAIVGDRVMAMVVAEHWVTHDRVVCDWQAYHNTWLTNERFQRIACETDLVSCMVFHPRNPFNPSSLRLSSTLLEAIVGAVYRDSGRDMAAVRKVMIALGFGEVVDLSEN